MALSSALAYGLLVESGGDAAASPESHDPQRSWRSPGRVFKSMFGLGEEDVSYSPVLFFLIIAEFGDVRIKSTSDR